VAPESRIVYVDNDPLVLAHAWALLTSSPEGKTAYIDADLRDIDKILDAAGQVLDFSRPGRADADRRAALHSRRR
jgi:S-adenosyl methyltransferase